MLDEGTRRRSHDARQARQHVAPCSADASAGPSPPRNRCQPLGIQVVTASLEFFEKDGFAMLLQYPSTTGTSRYAGLTAKAHAKAIVPSRRLLALTLRKPPGEWGADVVLGSAQRFGGAAGLWRPAAASGDKDEYKRQLPGRIVAYRSKPRQARLPPRADTPNSTSAARKRPQYLHRAVLLANIASFYTSTTARRA